MNTAYNVINRDLNEDDGPEATYEQVNERLLPKTDDYVQYPLESEIVRSSASKPDSKKKKSGSKVKCSVSLTIAVVILLVAVLSAVSSITMAVLYHGKSESIMRDIAQLKSQQNQTQQVSLTPGVNNPTMITNQLTSLTDTVRHLHEQFNNHSSTQISHELNKWIVETSSKITTLKKELNRTKRELEAQNAKLNTQAEIQLQIELSQAELNKTQKDSTSNISRLQVGMDVMHSQVNRALIHYQNCSKETEYCVLNADGNAELYWIQCETNRLPINTTVSCTHTRI